MWCQDFNSSSLQPVVQRFLQDVIDGGVNDYGLGHRDKLQVCGDLVAGPDGLGGCGVPSPVQLSPALVSISFRLPMCRGLAIGWNTVQQALGHALSAQSVFYSA